MTQLTDLKKKELYERYGLDSTLKQSKGQKEKKKLDLFCKYEDNEKKGPAIRYAILEEYAVPKEKIHGNVGREPINKGAVDKTSFKYQLAELLIQLGEIGYFTKNGYLDLLGFKSKNLKQLEKKFDGVKYHELKTTDQYVFRQTQLVQQALSKFMDGAFDLIRRNIFEGVTFDEQLMVVFDDESHEDADGLGDMEGLYSLFNQAKNEARENVKAEYGDSIFFTTRMNLENCECAELIESDEKYKTLYDNGISFFYQKYAINKPIVPRQYDYEVEDYDGGYDESNLLEVESAADDFLFKFVEHRKKASAEYIDRLIKKGVEGDFLSKSIMLFFADELFDFMFIDCGDKFDEVYDDLIVRAKAEENEQLEDGVNEAMAFLPFKAS
ncbi:hypothetical protein [Peribacillus simplex]|uniref:hypothetical protein n=1 Tax=Peribacillus simplex TaxID=1478 RepID=UPI0011DDA59C|nr:hypothetical protein [Peribacillus simplex]